TYEHPWEVTVDTGVLALCAGSFLDATPLYASARYARRLGFRDRPVHPLVLLNFGLSFSVHDVSEQAIAHLAYIDVRFPSACYAGDTVRAASTVLGVKRASEGARGVVHVLTVLCADDARVVCQFERKVLVKASGPAGAAVPRSVTAPSVGAEPSRVDVPAELGDPSGLSAVPGFGGFFEDFKPGDVICHDVGRTVSESEHMQLTYAFRNTHPLHFEEPYARSGFAKTRVVYGGLVLGWVSSLASRDTSGNALWMVRMDKGAHPAGVVAGDTLYAASQVLRTEVRSSVTGSVTFRLVGTKNVKPADLLDAGADLFSDELSKAGASGAKVKEKVVEIERTLLLRRKP
ncbi:MAG: MaoC family dehydratase, partial [Polyangiaceae bacterium]